MNRFLNTLPQIYQHLWPKELMGLNPIETKATCDNCLCSQNKNAKLPKYRSDLKCCTFHPFMPNYLIGEILSAASVADEFKEMIRQKIQQREYALPMGIFAPVNYQYEFLNREFQDFGNKESFLCPYFSKQNNNCGVWQFRGSVCTSYFCLSDRNDSGMRFWEAFGDYLNGLEMTLSQEFMAARGFSPELIEAGLEYMNCETGSPEELDSASMSQSMFNYLWWDYQLTEIEEFYKSASQYVKKLTKEDFNKILDPELKEMEHSLIQIYKQAGF